MVDSCRTCPTARGARAVLRGGRRCTYNSPEQHDRQDDLRRLLEPDRRRRGLRAADAGPARSGRGRAAALRRHHDLLAAAALGRRPRQRGSASSAWAAWATWASSSRARWARTSCCSRPRPARCADAKRLGADEVVRLERRRRRWRRTRTASTSSSTPWPRRTTSTRYVQLLKRDGTLCLVGVPEQPHPSPAAFHLIFGRRQLAGSLIGGHRARRRRCSTSARSTGSCRTSS